MPKHVQDLLTSLPAQYISVRQCCTMERGATECSKTKATEVARATGRAAQGQANTLDRVRTLRRRKIKLSVRAEGCGCAQRHKRRIEKARLCIDKIKEKKRILHNLLSPLGQWLPPGVSYSCRNRT